MHRDRAGIPAALLALGAVVYWWARIMAPATEFGLPAMDLFLQIHPMEAGAAAAWRSGDVPLWNPWQQCGRPFLASSLYGVLYPLNFPYLLLPAHFAIEVVVVLHLFLAGFFAYLFARALELERIPALGAGVTFMLSGFVAKEA